MKTNNSTTGQVPVQQTVSLLPTNADKIVNQIFKKITFIRRRLNQRRTMELIEMMLDDLKMEMKDSENLVTFRRSEGMVNISIQIGMSVVNLSTYEIVEGGQS